MNIRIGDIVRFISEKIEGKVTGIIDNTTLNVYSNEYGFEIPASISDLVVIRSDFNSAPAEKSQTTVQNPKSVTTQSANTVYLAIVPDNFNNLPESRYELHIINDTAQTCLYSVAFSNGEKYSGISAGNCSPDMACLIGTYAMKEVDAAIKAVNIQVIFYQKGNCTLKNTIDTQIKISTTALCKSGSYKHVKWFASMAFIRPLDKEHIAKEEIDTTQLIAAIKEKSEPEASSHRPQKQIVNNIVEIDLHCGELLETTAGMENKDILEYQLDVFRKTIEEYKLRKGQKIVFIHGKGDGVLRQRILWELQTKSLFKNI